MKPNLFILFLFFVGFFAQAQTIPKDTVPMGYVLKETDSILNDTIRLQEIVISKKKLDPEARKQFLLLQYRVYKTYPYAKLAAERLVALNKGMEYLNSTRDKKQYFKIVEQYLTHEFEEKLKKLSRKQGQILIKLIHRQTGVTTFQLIKNLKSGWKAFWSNTTANLFDISLKEEYKPYENNEDYLIETILYKAFEEGRLSRQVPAVSINYDQLNEHWETKAATQSK